jgi:cellulose synthase/poly-beta-1,6-N-acetylglucosamine synthase-like glycosyltransferase
MILFFSILLWFSFAEVLYSYTLYPLLLLLFVRFFGKPVRQESGYLPTVGVLVPAHNEEVIIRKKIENILSLQYPPEKLSVWVGSDCSTDATESIVATYPDKRVHLWVAPERGGKTEIVNRLAPQIEAEIILFTDANTMHRPDCLTAIVRNFADPAVGAVAGHIDHARAAEDDSGEGIYRSFESRQKYMEGQLHSTISAFGGFYAVRKEAFRTIPHNAYSNDDVLIPMNVIRQGLRVIYEPEAVSEEENTGNIASEYSRRVRIGAGNFQAFFWLLDFLNPARGWPAFCLVSHKFSRWFSPFFLFAGFISSGVLFFRSGIDLYRILFASGSIIVLAGMLYKIIPVRITRHVFYFLVMNIALMAGFYRFLRGIKSAAWSRTERID